MMDERHCENITTEALSQITPKLGKVNSRMPAKGLRKSIRKPDPTVRYAKSGIYSWKFDRVDPFVVGAG